MARTVLAAPQSKSMFPEFLGRLIAGVGAGVAVNALVDISRLPGLSEVGMFGNTTANNFETVASAVGVGGVVAGTFDVFTGNRILGFSKDLIPLLIGYLIGAQQWNSWIAAKLGVDKFNPYESLYEAIPSVPVIPGEFGPGELGLGGNGEPAEEEMY